MNSRPGRREPLSIDVEDLDPDVRAAVEALVRGEQVQVRRDHRPVGVLTFRSSVLEGVVVPGPRQAGVEDAGSRPPTDAPREGATVVATAVPMSADARARLSDSLGEDFVVVDVNAAPDSADVLLVHPVSPQLLGRLRARFTRARVIITEVEDDDLGLSLGGPVSRLLDAGASAYLPPRPLEEVATNVRTYLESTAPPALTRSEDGSQDGPHRLS